MDCILENPIISKQLFSYFSLSELGSLSTICKNTRYITKYATFTNGGRIKDKKKYFLKLIECYKEFQSLTLFNFESGSYIFYKDYYVYISEICKLYTVKGIQIYTIDNLVEQDEENNLVDLLDYKHLNFLILNNVNNQVSRSRISKFKNLKNLVIKNYIYTELQFLENLTNLSYLLLGSVSGTNSFSLDVITRLVNLEVLCVYSIPTIKNTEINDILFTCPKLKILDFSGCSFIIEENIKRYSKNNLTNIYFRTPFVNDLLLKCFKNSPELTKLDMMGCSSVSLQGFKILTNQSFNLTNLNISFTSLNNKALSYICENLGQLEIITISNCHNIDKFHYISKLNKLEFLYCRDNFIEDRDFVKIVNGAKNLQQIDISSCNLLTNKSLKTLTTKKIKRPPIIVCFPISKNILPENLTDYHKIHFYP